MTKNRFNDRVAFDPCDDIRAFHEKFELDYNGAAQALSLHLTQFRTKFMEEELDEYVVACVVQDLEGQLDALVDLVYVALGTAYLQGFAFREAWNRVHAANMTKVRAARPADSKRGSGFDVVKPATWVAPQLKDLVTPCED
jgi:predicted HAD superfamily Cof-like phosphohydrolase